MDLSRLAWIKIVRDDKHYWAYSLEAITALATDNEDQIIDSKNGLTIFPICFKRRERHDKIKCGDLMVLVQHAKITHIIEFLDAEFYEKGSWYHSHDFERGSWLHRYVKIIWWKREMNWEKLPSYLEILGFDLSIYDMNPHQFTSFDFFKERWGKDGDISLKAFQEYLAEQLQRI